MSKLSTLASIGRGNLLTPYLVIVPLCLTLSITLVLRGGWSTTALVVGLASWTLLEYLMHRFLLHPRGIVIAKLGADLHKAHHEHANDTAFIVAPVLITVMTFSLLFGLVALLLRNLDSALGWGTGVLIGYMIYELTHYMTHHYRASHPWLRALKKNHMHHHFKNHGRDFGVTSPLWDHVFGTRTK